MSGKYSYRDLGDPSYMSTIKGHNHTTLKLVRTGKSLIVILFE